MDKEVALKEIGGILGLSDQQTDLSGLFIRLSEYINELLINDFQKLVQLLYRLDVSEKLLLQVIHDNPNKDSGELIAGLMIDRQIKKIETRRNYKQREEEMGDEEKW